MMKKLSYVGMVAFVVFSPALFADDTSNASEPPGTPVPVLTPAEALAAFKLAPGFVIELVASEPLVVDPVAITWDEAGAMYAVEMRAFMPDVFGTGGKRAGRYSCQVDR